VNNQTRIPVYIQIRIPPPPLINNPFLPQSGYHSTLHQPRALRHRHPLIQNAHPHPHPDAPPSHHRHYLNIASSPLHTAITQTRHNGRHYPRTLEYTLRIRSENMCSQRRITRTQTYGDSRKNDPIHHKTRLQQSPTIPPPHFGRNHRSLATRRRRPQIRGQGRDT